MHGNGPFKVDRVQREDLSIRAAPRYRLVFMPVKDTPGYEEVWFSIKGPLRLESCDFRCPLMRSEWGSFSGGPGIWEIKNCRLFCLAGQAPLFRYTGSKLSVQDCLIIGWWVFRVQAQASVEEVELINNVVFSRGIADLQIAPQVTRLRNNTFAITEGFTKGDPQKPKAPALIEAVGNIFHISIQHTGGYILEAHGEPKDHFRWQGRDNLYVGAMPFLLDRPKVLAKDLAAWNKFWGSAEVGSRQVPDASYQHEAVWRLSPDKGLAILATLTDVWRKHNPSAPRQAGAELDLVGPGDAYVRALAAENRAIPKDRLRPDPDEKGAVALIRAGKQMASFLTLQAAADAAVNGDVIETRIDGVPAPCTIPAPTKGTKVLTLRGAPGYRTILAARPDMDAAVRAQDNVVLTVENLHFRKVALLAEKGARLPRIANCSFEKLTDAPCIDGWLLTADGQPGELVNCMAPDHVAVVLHDGDQPRFRNCVLAQVTSTGSAKINGQLQFDRCFFWAPGPQLRWAANIAYQDFKDKITLSVSNCWFEVGTQIPAPIAAKGLSLQKNVAWKGSQNIYRQGHRSWVTYFPENKLLEYDLESWKRYWNSPEEGCVVADPLDHDPLQWRLLPGSAGHKQGPGGKDFGADVDKVAR